MMIVASQLGPRLALRHQPWLIQSGPAFGLRFLAEPSSLDVAITHEMDPGQFVDSRLRRLQGLDIGRWPRS